MNDSSGFAKRFEELARSVLAANSFEVSDSTGQQYDFVINAAGTSWLVEVKYYRTPIAQITLIEAAAARLIEAGQAFPGQRGLLIISAILPAEARGAIEESFGLTILDRTELLLLASLRPELIDKLRAVLEGETPEVVSLGPSPLERARNARPFSQIQRRPTQDGAGLCAELSALEPGRANWRRFEAMCENILKYLFVDDLHGWHQQLRTEDGFNRFDCICRIKSERAFWRFLTHHLDSRYILFEFKNYSRQVKQGQILTTEKYLFSRGLRRSAIIITRAGADNGAKAAIAGAMREHGKLMLVIDDKHLCTMLRMRAKGDDPSDLLFEIADDFLMTLSR